MYHCMMGFFFEFFHNPSDVSYLMKLVLFLILIMMSCLPSTHVHAKLDFW